MSTLIDVDDILLAKAAKMAGHADQSAVVQEGLRALIDRECAKRLAQLGGSELGSRHVRRRRGAIEP